MSFHTLIEYLAHSLPPRSLARFLLILILLLVLIHLNLLEACWFFLAKWDEAFLINIMLFYGKCHTESSQWEQ